MELHDDRVAGDGGLQVREPEEHGDGDRYADDGDRRRYRSARCDEERPHRERHGDRDDEPQPRLAEPLLFAEVRHRPER